MDAKAVVIRNEILRGVVGSTAHGLAIEGQDDRDEMGVFIEPAPYVCGLTSLDHYIQRDQPDGVRSQPGDLDLTMYSLRKFCQLASKGNPSVLVLLWLPDHIVRSSIGQQLVALRDAFISQECGERFLGYLVAQKKRLLGERSANVNRPELIEKYGYDTKFASHALRLGLEGIEIMTDRRLTLPIAEPNLSVLRAIKMGEVSKEEALALIEETEIRLRHLVEGCPWQADRQKINDFLVAAHQVHWSFEV
jgi:predicted nucleotidyltransferase